MRPETLDSATTPRNVGAMRPALALWASAFVLAALTIVQIGRGAGREAFAGTVSTIGEVTGLTASSSLDEDIFCVLDGRSESLLVYRVENQNRVELLQTIRLPEAFAEARGGGGGGARPRR